MDVLAFSIDAITANNCISGRRRHTLQPLDDQQRITIGSRAALASSVSRSKSTH